MLHLAENIALIRILAWEENVKDKLHPTRQREVRRKFERIIQALKVIIHDLTPFMERTEDQPSLIKRKNKTK